MHSIRDIGKKFSEYLDSVDVNLTEDDDGRLESLNSEDAITDALRENFPDVNFLEKGHNRSFGDIDIEIDGRIYSINVKIVSEKTGTYNAGGPKVFNYILFGKTNTGWNSLVKRVLADKPSDIHSEYFYLVYYKRCDKSTQFISLTDVDDKSIVTNPSNPIQLKQNLLITNRTPQEKVDFIVGLLVEVLKKRANPYLLLTGAI